MNFIKHPGNNMTLNAPPSWNKSSVECQSLPVTRSMSFGYVTLTSFWRPTPDELATLQMGGAVKLTVWGGSHPPVSLEVD